MKKAAILAALLSLLIALPFPREAAAAEAPGTRVFTIAAQKGNWGFPAPYLHFFPHQGYLRMSFLFDTLLALPA